MSVAPENGRLPRNHGMRRQEIVESLLCDVLAGKLHAGRHLVTQELAERFGVSHTPIREALLVLAGMGVIDLMPNRGAVVRRVTKKDVREILHVRRALECEAVRGACGRIDADELGTLAKDLRRLKAKSVRRKASFVKDARQLDSRLHDLIASSSGNAFLAKELSRLTLLFRVFRDVSYIRHEERNDFRRLTEEADEHLAIVDALLAGEGREAVRAMARHIRGGVKYWCRSLPEVSAIEGNGNGASDGAQRFVPRRTNGRTPHDQK